MVTQIAGRREERRLAVLVAAVAGNRVQRGERRLQLLRDRRWSSAKEKTRRCVVDVLALAEPGADDDAGDARLLEHVAGGHVGDRDAVPRGHTVRCRGSTRCSASQPAGDADEAAVLHLRPRAGAFPVGLVAGRASDRSASRRRACRRRADATPCARQNGASARPRARSSSENDTWFEITSMPLAMHHVEMRRVDVGQAQMADQALALQVLQDETALEPARIGIVPRMKLQQIDRIGSEAAAARARRPRARRRASAARACGTHFVSSCTDALRRPRADSRPR